MIIEEKCEDGTVFSYDGKSFWIHMRAWNHKAPANAFNLVDAHQECYDKLLKRVERKKKLEKLLS